MVSLFTKKLASVISLRPSSRHLNSTFSTPLFHFSTQIQQKEHLPFIAEYLISSFGFSEERTLRVGATNHLAPINNSYRPEYVVRFLKDTGLSDTHVKIAISWAPQLLSTSVSRTLESVVHDVISAGFTRETLVQLIRYNPSVLTSHNFLAFRDFNVLR